MLEPCWGRPANGLCLTQWTECVTNARQEKTADENEIDSCKIVTIHCISRQGDMTVQSGAPETLSADFVVERDYSKLRRAAASQSLPRLQEEISMGGWTARDIDDNDAYNCAKGKQKQRQHASKSALHMAAWKGCLENVRYLIETLGCDVNAYSKQEFSYGKTALFFALTQSRPDVTEYLLSKGAKVTIVNNKGQSVLSMAATHFETDDDRRDAIVNTIQKLEAEQGDWWNFRATHSDGFEYGDLDPRFFEDRPLRDTDIVTPLAINPTSKQTRKGGFLRRNPGAKERPFNEQFKTGGRGAKPKQPRRRKKEPLPTLSLQEQAELDRCWESFLVAAAEWDASTGKVFPTELFWEILRLSDKKRSSWIPRATTRLIDGFGTEQAVGMIKQAITDSPTPRQLQLLEKILSRLRGDDRSKEPQQHQEDRDTSMPESKFQRNAGFDSSELWASARSEVQGLSVLSLEETGSTILSLPTSSILVDTVDALQNLLDRFSTQKLVAIDTEWHAPKHSSKTINDTKPKATLSTLQIAVWNRKEHLLLAYVVDLMKASCIATPTKYRQLAKSLVHQLLQACSTVQKGESSNLPLVLGFAISHDLPVLEEFLKDIDNLSTGAMDKSGPYARVLDLQPVFALDSQRARAGTGTKPILSQLPGLKACVAKYASVPLSKDCQCSEWGHRPLSKAQLDYAGLDAAILLVLLAERSSEDSGQRTHGNHE